MMDQGADPPRAVIVISSHVARGSVGNRAAVFALGNARLSGLGRADRHAALAPGTWTLDAHRSAAGTVRVLHEGSRTLALARRSRRRAVGLSRRCSTGRRRRFAGQGGAPAQPKAIYVCDPVMGDSGGLYVGEALAERLRDELIPIADIATPNRFELEWLSGGKLDDLRSVMAAAMELGPPSMLVTSAPAMMAGGIANLLVTQSAAMMAEHRVIEKPPNGLGDSRRPSSLPGSWTDRRPQKRCSRPPPRCSRSSRARQARRRRVADRNGCAKPPASHGDGAAAPSHPSRPRPPRVIDPAATLPVSTAARAGGSWCGTSRRRFERPCHPDLRRLDP